MTLRTVASIEGIDKPVSNLALGTAFYVTESKETWFDLLDTYCELGGTVLDSARIYAGGQSEQVVGEWLQQRDCRDEVVLITKCGHGEGVLPAGDIPQLVHDELEKSLDSLHTDYVDLYMLHRDNPKVPVGAILDALNAPLQAGRVRALGASNWTYDRLDEAAAYAAAHGLAGFAAVSNNLSLAEPACPFFPGLVSVDRAGIEWHRRTGVPLISWSSQARGFFRGDLTPDLAASHEINDNPWMKRMLEVYGTDANFERLHRAKELGHTKGDRTAMEVALAWVLHAPCSVIPIAGPHTRDELISCTHAAALELSDAEWRWLNLETERL